MQGFRSLTRFCTGKVTRARAQHNQHNIDVIPNGFSREEPAFSRQRHDSMCPPNPPAHPKANYAAPQSAINQRPVEKNQLYYGDNLAVLREYIKDESVDLIYLDPPFNSRQDYNVLFAERDGTRSASQIMAFEDTWEWNLDAEAAYREIVERGGRVSDAMQAFRTFLGHSDMMAYLARWLRA